MMTKPSKQLLRNLLIVLISFKSVHAQQDSSRDHHQGHEDSEDHEVNELDLKSASGNQLFRMMMISFAGSCSIMLLFFCLKIYCEYRIRNTPVVDLGPFEGLRDVSISDLTVPQRKAIVAVLFSDDKCMKFHKVSKNRQSH